MCSGGTRARERRANADGEGTAGCCCPAPQGLPTPSSLRAGTRRDSSIDTGSGAPSGGAPSPATALASGQSDPGGGSAGAPSDRALRLTSIGDDGDECSTGDLQPSRGVSRMALGDATTNGLSGPPSCTMATLAGPGDAEEPTSDAGSCGGSPLSSVDTAVVGGCITMWSLRDTDGRLASPPQGVAASEGVGWGLLLRGAPPSGRNANRGTSPSCGSGGHAGRRWGSSSGAGVRPGVARRNADVHCSGSGDNDGTALGDTTMPRCTSAVLLPRCASALIRGRGSDAAVRNARSADMGP